MSVMTQLVLTVAAVWLASLALVVGAVEHASHRRRQGDKFGRMVAQQRRDFRVDL